MADDDVAELQAKLQQAEARAEEHRQHLVDAELQLVDSWRRVTAAESALAAAQGAWKALRANILVSDGADKVMRGVWFRGGDAVAQVHAVDAALAAESGKPGGEAPTARPQDLDGLAAVLATGERRPVLDPDAAEPRAAPPALPAELSGKWEQPEPGEAKKEEG